MRSGSGNSRRISGRSSSVDGVTVWYGLAGAASVDFAQMHLTGCTPII
jgi:hypothetical protein